jgi:hypothetical protein
MGGSEGNDEILTWRRRGSFIQARLDAEVAVQVAGQREPWDDDDSSDEANHEKPQSQSCTSATGGLSCDLKSAEPYLRIRSA